MTFSAEPNSSLASQLACEDGSSLGGLLSLPPTVEMPAASVRLADGRCVFAADYDAVLSLLESADRVSASITNLDSNGRVVELNIERCGVEDITAIALLTQLRELEARGNAISDLTPLADLKGLENLYLGENDISNISPIASLPLWGLDLSRNRLIDISPIASMVTLWDLDLSGNGIVDPSPVNNLLELRRLSLASNNITVLPSLHAPRLSMLDVSNNQIEEVSPLCGLQHLVSLQVASNCITDISPLSTLPRLMGIDISANRIDITSLNQLTRLRDLYLDNTQLQHVGQLPALTGLRTVSAN